MLFFKISRSSYLRSSSPERGVSSVSLIFMVSSMSIFRPACTCPSDHLSDGGMHRLMCIAILISGICSDECGNVYDTNRQPSPGNCLIWDSMTSVQAAVLISQVSITFLTAQEAQVWDSEHFSIPSLDSVGLLSSSENGAHHLLGALLLVSPSWRTSAVLH